MSLTPRFATFQKQEHGEGSFCFSPGLCPPALSLLESKIATAFLNGRFSAFDLSPNRKTHCQRVSYCFFFVSCVRPPVYFPTQSGREKSTLPVFSLDTLGFPRNFLHCTWTRAGICKLSSDSGGKKFARREHSVKPQGYLGLSRDFCNRDPPHSDQKC